MCGDGTSENVSSYKTWTHSVTGSALKEVLKCFDIKLPLKNLTFVDDHTRTNTNAVFRIIAFP